MKAVSSKVNFGEYLHSLRVEHQMPLRAVANKLGIDVSLLSKIEHGERYIQSHMLVGLAELFDLDYRELQIEYLNQKLEEEFGEEPFIEDAIQKFLKERLG